MTEISSAPRNIKILRVEAASGGEAGPEWLVAGCQVELSGEDHGHSGREEPAKEVCCDKSDSQPYFYSSINLIWGVVGRAQRGGGYGDVGAGRK